MRHIESTAVAVMLICGALALTGCTAVSMVASFIFAAVVRAGIEVKHMIEEVQQ